jgi:monofunctional biosynthetic peptidoglycan transglycosylase
MKAIWRWLVLAVLALLGLQLYFVLHIASLAVVNPGSTAFQRSEVWTQLRDHQAIRWRQEWVPYDQISDHLKRAVIASEDADFIHHGGVEWDAIEKARLRNAQAEARAARKLAATSKKTPASTTPVPNPKVVGGSTITQQLAKNLFLSGERTLLRKGEELVLSFALEQLLSKRRIMELYLNSVEWGNGVFGAEAAAQHYFRKPAAALTPGEAARLAVMLPRPKYFEKLPQSGYLANRSATIAARMGQVAVP